MRDIPFFSARQINLIQDYQRFRNTKSYISSRSSRFETTRELMEKSGYAKLNKFRSHRKEFDDMSRDIPLGYLEAIGINSATFRFCNELDYEEFESARNIEVLYPEYGTVRYMACVYSSVKFPSKLTEDMAVEYLQDHYGSKGFICWINYPDFKTVLIKPGENAKRFYYPPEIRYTKLHAVSIGDGSRIGRTYM